MPTHGLALHTMMHGRSEVAPEGFGKVGFLVDHQSCHTLSAALAEKVGFLGVIKILQRIKNEKLT